MNDEIVIRFRPELRDQVHASVVHYRAGRLRICDRIAGTIGAMAGVTLFVVNGWRWWLAILIPVAIAEWSDVLHAHALQAWVSFKRNPKFRTEYALTFRPEGIRFKTATIDSNLDWSYYDGVVEDSRLFLLRYGKSLYTVIPKSAFTNEGDMDRFRELARMKIAAYRICGRKGHSKNGPVVQDATQYEAKSEL